MKAHILLVDDEIGFSQILSLYFIHKGFAVTTAATGKAARDSIENCQFDLAILDPNLGSDDGLEILRFCKSKVPGLPVLIFARRDGDEAAFKKCLSGRVEGIMRKTAGLDRLLAEVRQHLPGEVLQRHSEAAEMTVA